MCQDFGDAKKGLRFCSLEIVGKEVWTVQEESEAQCLSQKTCKISTTHVNFIYNYIIQFYFTFAK